MTSFTTPSQTEQLGLDSQNNNPQFVTQNWYLFFNNIRNWIVQNSQSGTTANRPKVGLYAGRFYFDTSLGANGKPIWVAKDNKTWIDATSTPV